MTSVFERGLPANADAERYVLGSILLNDDRYSDVFSILAAEDFSLEKHRRIFSRIKDLYDRGENIDRVTVADELNRHGQLDSVDGLSYLISLDDGLPEIANLDSYVRIVKEKSLLRRTIFGRQKIIDQCLLASEPSTEILEAGATLLDRLQTAGETKNRQWFTPGEVLLERVDAVLFPGQSNAVGLQTPWPRLTEMTSGWNPGELVIAAGRPGMGKSVIGLQQAHKTASQGVGVAYVSLEMSKESLVRRLIAGISRIDSHRARFGFLSSEERRRMLETAADLDSLPLYIDDSRAHTPTALSAALRKLKSRAPLGLVVIDHLQLMKVTGRAESRHHELSEICHGLKRLALQMQCAVMVLSQLNRSCELENRSPVLSDLKESGSIEEDADVVLFVHRPEMYRRDDPSLRGQAQFIVAKQRTGPTGRLAMTFLHGFQVFEQATADAEDPL
jgi:replicative DNA helicase